MMIVLVYNLRPNGQHFTLWGEVRRRGRGDNQSNKERTQEGAVG